jgi:hypothetical protein
MPPSTKDQTHFCGPDLQVLPAALFLALILFTRTADEMMGYYAYGLSPLNPAASNPRFSHIYNSRFWSLCVLMLD